VHGGRLGFVVGLAAEARILRRLDVMVAIGGGTAAGAADAARRLAEAGVAGLVSFGLAGGLDPALRPGSILVPHAVIANGTRVVADSALCDALGGPTPHVLFGSDHVVASAAEKRLLWQQAGCEAVDIESGMVAAVSIDRSLLFAALRAVCDPAWRTLPAAAMNAVDRRGAIGVHRVIASLAAHPGQAPQLLALARDAMAARGALRRHIRRLAGGKSFIFGV